MLPSTTTIKRSCFTGAFSGVRLFSVLGKPRNVNPDNHVAALHDAAADGGIPAYYTHHIFVTQVNQRPAFYRLSI